MSIELIYNHQKDTPPGLFLPLPEEPTDRYKVDYLNKSGIEFEDVVDLGAFAVALAVFDAKAGNRVSVMPTSRDFSDLFDAGYGMSPARMYADHGGVKAIQRALGFYANGDSPDRVELLERFQWIANYALPRDPDAEIESITDVICWAAARDLTPTRNSVFKIFNYNLVELRAMFNVERRHVKRPGTYLNIYRFGAKVLDDTDGQPLGEKDLNSRYPDYFIGSAYRTVKYYFGSLTNFWLEYGLIPNSRGMAKEDLLRFGVRWAINHKGHVPSTAEMSKLSSDNLYVTDMPLKNHFKGAVVYREAVKKGYERYQVLKDKLARQGVDDSVVQIASRLYEPTDEYESYIFANLDTLKKLSEDSKRAKWLLRIMKDGLDLLDEDIFEMQLVDVMSTLEKLKIKDDDAKQFVLTIIPRLNAGEVIEIANRP